MSPQNSLKPQIPPQVLRIIELLERGGATDVLIVGGFVRDYLLGLPSKDVDVEVYGLSYSQIRNVLAPYFHVDFVGQSFGVLKVGRDVDVALPRRESKVGIGHKGFDVEATPNLSPQEAFSRRDFTINAVGMRRDGSFCDPFDGIDDLRNRKLRAVGPAFKDDPLRVLRGMQFAARFGFSIDAQTVQYCRDVFSEFQTLSEERIYEEWKKWALKGQFPELGLEFLRETGWIDGFPELAALVDRPQNPKKRPTEEDAWTRAKAVCRAAADVVRDFRPELSEDERLALMFAALGRNFEKPSSTTENERICSLDRAEVGVSPIRTFLERMKAPIRIVKTVAPLVAEPMGTRQDFGPDGPSGRTIRRLATRLAPANIKLWTLLCRADAFAGGTTRQIRSDADYWLEIAAKLNLLESAPKPLVLGRNLVALGLKPGPKMGEILREAFEAQLDGEFFDVAGGIEFLKTRGLL